VFHIFHVSYNGNRILLHQYRALHTMAEFRFQVLPCSTLQAHTQVQRMDRSLHCLLVHLYFTLGVYLHQARTHNLDSWIIQTILSSITE
jgi:hypothetical protein